MLDIVICLPQIRARKFFVLAELEHLSVAVVVILFQRGEHHVMKSSLFEDAAEAVIVDIFVDYLGSASIAKAFQAFLHVVPLELDTTCVDEAKFLMDVPSYVADPIVIVAILSKFRTTLGHVYI